jgi:hypothetical protein
MAELVPACVWRISAELVSALDTRFGDPVDAYVNGSQTWLRDDGPGDIAIEWRLHPVAGYRRPVAIESHDDVFPTIALALGTGEEPPVPPETLWDGLEAFPAYGDEVEPAPLAAALTKALGLVPDAVGLVDHQRIGDDWERTQGRSSIVEGLIAQLTHR